jgi:transcriptional regulator with PAS, ATPase and Fis domain
LNLPPFSTPMSSEQEVQASLKERLQQIEKALIEESLFRHQHCVDNVAVELKVTKRTLYYRMKQLAISLR